MTTEEQIQQQTQTFVQDEVGRLVLVNARLRAEVSVLAAALARAEQERTGALSAEQPLGEQHG